MPYEVRKVPANWEHPKDEKGGFKELLGWSIEDDIADWDPEDEEDYPKECDYMPNWPTNERTHFQMYFTVGNGIPMSPVMETQEALARWLADNSTPETAGCASGATYEQWLAMIIEGWAADFEIGGRHLLSAGVSERVDTSEYYDRLEKKLRADFLAFQASNHTK